MKLPFPALSRKRLAGTELFTMKGRKTGINVADFWAWSVSDLMSNATRGRLAEFIVAKAMGISTDGVRDEWAAYDLITENGIKIEVKSAAFLQTWAQRRASTISFSIRPARAWEPETNRLAEKPERLTDVYVFALLAHMDKSTIDPTNLDQWEFYVMSTRDICARKRSQHSIALNSLKILKAGPYSFRELKNAVLVVVESTKSHG